ncbi:Protein of unknown function [Bacillus mycoides]|nr:Protein of unknown function [Bacillus mycoides]SCM91596.1 Protein of unknown function [Bacillus mycoides]
MEKLLA